VCRRGYRRENAEHYLLYCEYYLDIPNEMLVQLEEFNIDVFTLLNGSDQLSSDNNTIIFRSVHNYIKKTKRFA